MSAAAITIDSISKVYRIGKVREQHDTLAMAMWAWARSPLENFRRLRSLTDFRDLETADDVKWALRDVSIELRGGDVIGLIGRNGAGKSTLLKVLSRITQPTRGEVVLRGRVGSLLEVGTGFHADLTGRENIYLNGSILGMRRHEIDRSLEAIVEFAGVGRYIDTPVKRYSTGMYLRLAFSVAAHLETEILLVDEVLAVGDATFQKKCLGKIESLAGEGRTVVFVSHNLSAVRELCQNAMLLDGGRLVEYGETNQVIGRYLAAADQLESQWVATERKEGAALQFEALRVKSSDGTLCSSFGWNDPVNLEIDYSIARRIVGARVGFILEDRRGQYVLRSGDTDKLQGLARTREPGTYRASCQIPPRLLNAGEYVLSLVCDAYPNWVARAERVARFQVEDLSVPGGQYSLAAIRPDLDWSSEPTEPAAALQEPG